MAAIRSCVQRRDARTSGRERGTAGNRVLQSSNGAGTAVIDSVTEPQPLCDFGDVFLFAGWEQSDYKKSDIQRNCSTQEK
ncbi:MAG TPA: hypothetical protein PLF81_21095 [Candidatus Anammoximicrobium sp.]|nr:hypothetical protein [Candidatus Anammoximicrobium sp.]